MTEWVDWPRGAVHTKVSSVMLEKDWTTRPECVYIGMPGYAGQTVGPYGKPWACKSDPRGWRAAYKQYLHDRLIADIPFRKSVMRLHGRTLVCFCKGGKRGLDPDCHGDLLAQAAEFLYHREFGE